MTPKNPLSLIRDNADPNRLLPVKNVKKREYDALPDKDKVLYVWDAEAERYNIPDSTWASELRTGKHFGIKTAIGGSDVGVLLDGSDFIKSWQFYEGQHGSNYKTALQLFHEKTGVEPEIKEKQDDYILFNGHNLEEAVAQKFIRMYRKNHPDDEIEMKNDTHIYQCGIREQKGNLKYPFALGNFDRIIEVNGLKGILEIKTTFRNADGYELWDQGIVPLKYMVQVLYYLAIANLSFAYIACDKGFGEDDLTYIYIERNLSVEDDLMEMVKKFVECVENQVEPDVSEQDVDKLLAYRARVIGSYDPKKVGPTQFPESYADILLRLKEINEKRDFLKKEDETLKKEASTLLAQIIEPYGKSSCAYCKISENKTLRLTMNPRVNESRRGIDTEKLKKEDPELYMQYRTKFDDSLFKKEQKGIFRKYLKEPVLSESFTKYSVEVLEEKNYE